jgi:hypothetical protein
MTEYSSIRVKKDLRPYVGDIDAGAVPCGFGRAIGNKVCVSSFVLLIFHVCSCSL